MIRRLLAATTALALAGCASDQALFARYDQLCPRADHVVAAGLASATAIAVRGDGHVWEPAVYFGFDRASLDTAGRARLDRNLEILARHPGWQVSVRAYADRIGGHRYNQRLSERRLQAVIAYLRDHGLAGSRIRNTALGDQMPILPDADQQQRAINRRVELLLLDDQGRPLILHAGAGAADTFLPPAPVK